MTIGILGGGLSGVTLQKYLKADSEILEKEARIGGLCRSFVKNGFTYDLGGHILYSKSEDVLKTIKQFLGKNIYYYHRDVKISYKGKYLKYPFENGIGALDKEERAKLLIGYLQNPHIGVPKNFLEWVYHVFGDGIAESYLIPYNTKIWKYPLNKMGTSWVDRVPKPPVEDVIKSALGIETEGYTHQLNALYPKTGGIENLVKLIYGRAGRSVQGFAIKKISHNRRSWKVESEQDVREFDKLVITYPVKEAVKALGIVPEKVKLAASALRSNSLRVVMVGINNQSLLNMGGIYFPEPDVIFHRACYMGFFSPGNVPKGKSSVIVEITSNGHDEISKASDASIIEKAVEGLSNKHIINKRDIVTTDIQNIKYGYVVYDLDYEKNIKIINDYFSNLGIHLLGRFAQWDYINMDEVIRRAIALADKINKED